MDARFKDDPNFNLLLEAAGALEELREQLVFLGGCATSLLITAVRAESIRATRDVDAVVEVVSAADYHAFERKLVAKGFQPDVAPDAPICRRIRNGIRLDVMPPIPALLGFGNRWYPQVLQSWKPFELAEEVSIRLVTAPLFIATKLEAFRGRGKRDYLGSHDLEDLLSVVDGRGELLDELAGCDDELRNYISKEIGALLRNDNFIAALPGHLPADPGAQARLPQLISRLRSISGP